MGFLNKKPVIRQEGFHPLELNEDNVRAIFERCLAKEDEPSTFAQVLQKALSGKESDVVRFSQAKISENSKNISLTPFSIQDDKTLVTDINTITPTLSPKDPAFPAWWEAHKGEWEQ